MKKQTLCPTEDQEQTSFVDWLDFKGLKFTAIPNSTYTSSWSQKAKNKRNGLRAGLPDMLVVIPDKCLIFVEMKRTKNSVTSKFQKEWIEALNTVPNVECRICKGCQKAIEFIEEIL